MQYELWNDSHHDNHKIVKTMLKKQQNKSK